MSDFAGRFWEKVSVGAPNECWPWQACTSHGYGDFHLDGKTVDAHRVSFFLKHGWWPELVMHTCDNRPCVNPAHLEPGTKLLNNQDMTRKNRVGHSENHGRAKITNDQVRAMRAAGKWGSYREIGDANGIGWSAARDILLEITWKRLL